MAFSFIIGFDPGKPKQTSHIQVFGSSSSLGTLQEQNNFVFVFNWTCVSKPIITIINYFCG